MKLPSLSERVFRHAARYAAPFRSPGGLACAALPLTTFNHQTVLIRSRGFRQWLAATFFAEHDVFPTRHALSEAIFLLEAQAIFTPAHDHPVELRLAARGNAYAPDEILLDLADSDGRAVRITPQGWDVTDSESACFRHTAAMQPLPAPVADALPQTSLPLLNPAITDWLVSALRPHGPYPILILHGPAASGKSTAARMLRSLIDPSTTPFQTPTRSPRELNELAWENRVLAFDHYQPSNQTAAALTALERPILLTTTADPHTNPRWAHLRESAITVELPALTSATRRTPHSLWTEFEAQRPALLANLCSAASASLSNRILTAGS